MPGSPFEWRSKQIRRTCHCGVHVLTVVHVSYFQQEAGTFSHSVDDRMQGADESKSEERLRVSRLHIMDERILNVSQ